MIYEVYKHLGETPLEALECLRASEDPSHDHSWTYAGRLDPMAEGWMYILSGDDVYRKNEFTNLDKKYEVAILWGVATDTYDLLGIPTQTVEPRVPSADDIQQEIRKWETTFEQAYPPYSSKPVNGKPLWQWAREGRLDEIEVPTKRVTIYEVAYTSDRTISGSEVLRTVHERCDLVNQDFRQADIKEAWEAAVNNQSYQFGVTTLSVCCSSGTYIRSLVHSLGLSLGTGACALAIKREGMFDSCGRYQ